MCLGCSDFETAAKAIREIPRNELGIETVMMNSNEFSRVFGIDTDGGYPWIVVLGLRGKEKLVAYQENRLKNIAEKFKCGLMEVDDAAVTGKLDSPWYADKAPHIGFYAKFPDTGDYHKIVEEHAKKADFSADDTGTVLVSFSRGACAYQFYNFHGAEENISEDLSLDLLAKGAYFDLPHGKLADKIYSSMPGYLNLLKRIKNMTDPKGILNPGIPVAL